ncbi:MAG: hypothetical protein OH316_00970 [Candidatus Parvarchaeota archaeon]|nr:hypothetical protein [Candidatus Parvarchaeota archaeon]MCW1301693.1 hypothetical protein [Candidatus Parvarchaeota archaeon]
MKRHNYEKMVERGAIGFAFFLGFVSLFYSWIDSVAGINVNPYILTAIGIVIAGFIVYLMYRFDRE